MNLINKKNILKYGIIIFRGVSKIE